jgi:hypothetical protein
MRTTVVVFMSWLSWVALLIGAAQADAPLAAAPPADFSRSSAGPVELGCVDASTGGPSLGAAAHGDRCTVGQVALGHGFSVQSADDVTASPAISAGVGRADVSVTVALVDRPGLQLTLGAGFEGTQAPAILQGATAATAVSVAVSAAAGGFDLRLDVRALHRFTAMADSLDTYARLAVTRPLGKGVAAGVEYVGEELEGALGDDGDVGAAGRQYVGPAFFLRPGGPVTVGLAAGPLLIGRELGALALTTASFDFR